MEERKPSRWARTHVPLLAGFFALLLLLLFLFIYFYVSNTFRPAPKMEIFAENRYAETLRVVTDIDYAPFSYVDENGDYAGLDVELMNEIANRLEVNLELTLTDWPTANAMLLRGEAQILMNTETDLLTGDARLITTIPTTEKQYVVYGRETVSSVPELYGRRVASLHALPELGLDEWITYIDSYAEIFEGLKDGEFDFAICPVQVGNSFLEKLDIRGVHPSYAVSHIYGALALAAGNEALRDRLNPVIRDLQREGFLEKLDRKWVNHHYENVTLEAILENHPALTASAAVAVFLLVMAFVLILFLRHSAAAKDAFTRQLQEQNLALAEARERERAAGSAKTTFLFNMSHDIRTPMNAIIGYTNLAERETDPAVVRDYLTKIKASSQHLLALINDVLEMSRIESGKMELELADVNLVRTMDEVRDMFQTQMTEKGIGYTVDASGVRDPWVRCDKNRLNRVLLNLLSNAYKFTPSGGRVSVTLTQAEEDRRYELRVRDSGIGMTPEFAGRVFEAFERERSSTVSGIQGTGLGMAITKSIVDLMGGEIAVETAPGQGTAFIVSLRLEPAAERHEEAPPDEGPAEPSEADFTGRKLLLVEDNEINREIASLLLDELGFQLDTAENGQEAVERIEQAPPGEYDAVLMDVQMPVMDGYTATRTIRALEDAEKARVPIIAMTANAFHEDIQAAKDAGMDGHIAKPIDVSRMLETLRRVIR